MDLSRSKDQILDRFKEDDSEIEELSRIEESELLQSPKFKKMQSSSSPRSTPSSPSKSITKENSQLFDSIPKLRYRPSNQLLKTPTKPKENRRLSISKSSLKLPNRQLNFTPAKPTRIKHEEESSRVSLTPAQRLEKKPGRLLTTSDILSCYEFKETVGRGAFANVYRAINKTTNDQVAVKEIFIEEKDDIIELMSEIDLLKILKHKNIVKYHGFIRNEKKLLIFLEYCAGGSLRTLYKNSGPLSEEYIISSLKQVLNGLIYLHEQGVVHRDVKAANILLTDKGDIKLTDFGVSTKVSSNTIKTFSIAGTPNWMAPEIISMDGTSTASDIWSLGATVVELLSGEPLYAHLNEMAALHAIVTDEYPPIPESIPPKCKDFLMKCFEKQPSKRITAKELLNHEWLTTVESNSTKNDKTLYLSNLKNIKVTRREFNSIKRFNAKNFLPFDASTFKHTNIDSFIGSDFALKLENIDLKENRTSKHSPKMFESIVIEKNQSSIEKLKKRLLKDPFNIKEILDFNSILNDQILKKVCDPELLLNCLQWLDVKFNTDLKLSEQYLGLIRKIVNSGEGVAGFVDFSGFPLVSKLLHNKFEKAIRVLAMEILKTCFDFDVSYIQNFIQSNGLKYVLKMLQDDYKEQKEFSLFAVDVIYCVIYHKIIPWSRFQLILSNYPNFLDWLAVDLMQFVDSRNQKAVSQAIFIIRKIQGSNKFSVKPIFLNSIFKVYKRLNPSERAAILKFISELNIIEISESSNLLRFLVKALKWENKNDAVHNEHLNIISSMIFKICHLNHPKQVEIIKLGVLPTLQCLFNSTLPCTEYIIPLFCEFAFNLKLAPFIFESDTNMISNYIASLIDPIWQANALDSITALHDKAGDDRVAESLLHDEQNFLLNSFLIEESLNYELYLEKLVKFLSSRVNSIKVNEIRLKFLDNKRVVETILKRITRHRSNVVIQINLFRLLKILFLNNFKHKQYVSVVHFILSSPKSKILVVEQLKNEIIQLDKTKGNSIMGQPVLRMNHKTV